MTNLRLSWNFKIFFKDNPRNENDYESTEYHSTIPLEELKEVIAFVKNKTKTEKVLHEVYLIKHLRKRNWINCFKHETNYVWVKRSIKILYILFDLIGCNS